MDKVLRRTFLCGWSLCSSLSLRWSAFSWHPYGTGHRGPGRPENSPQYPIIRRSRSTAQAVSTSQLTSEPFRYPGTTSPRGPRRSWSPTFIMPMTYFPKNQWQIVSRMTQSDSSRGLYAIEGSDNANIMITAAGRGAAVIMIYGTGFAQTPPPPASLTVKQGTTLAAGFPKDLIVDPSAKVLSSSDNPDPATGIHTTAAVYQSGESVTALYNQYLTLFSGGSWRSNKENSSLPAIISAQNNATGQQVSVQIQSGTAGQSNVIVSSKVPN